MASFFDEVRKIGGIKTKDEEEEEKKSIPVNKTADIARKKQNELGSAGNLVESATTNPISEQKVQRVESAKILSGDDKESSGYLSPAEKRWRALAQPRTAGDSANYDYTPVAQKRRQAVSDQIYENYLKGEAYLQSEGEDLAKGFINRFRSTPGKAVEDFAYLIADLFPGYTPAKNTVENNTAGSIYDKASEQFYNAKEKNDSWLGDRIIDAADSAASMLSYMTFFGPKGYNAAQGIGGGLGEYRSQREDGADIGESLFRGTASGATSYLVEKAGGIGSKNGGALKITESNFGTVLKAMLKNAAEEAGEEAAEYSIDALVIDTLADWIFQGEVTVDYDVIEMINQAVSGGIIGAGFGGISQLREAAGSKTGAGQQTAESPETGQESKAQNNAENESKTKETAFASPAEQPKAENYIVDDSELLSDEEIQANIDALRKKTNQDGDNTEEMRKQLIASDEEPPSDTKSEETVLEKIERADSDTQNPITKQDVSEAAKILEESESEILEEPVPERHLTEEEKRKIRSLLEKKLYAGAKRNLEAIEHGGLSIDNIIFKGAVPGFNDLQRAVMVKQLIAQQDKDIINIDIPNDGKIELNNEEHAIATFLDQLKVSVDPNKDSNLGKAAENVLGDKNFSVTHIETGGKHYLSNGMIIVAANEDGVSKIKGNNPSGFRETSDNIIERFENAVSEIINTAPTVVAVDGKKYYVFKTESGKYAFDKKLIDAIDGETMYLGKFSYLSGRSDPFVKTIDENGEITGIAAGLAPNSRKTTEIIEKAEESTETAKLRSLSGKKRSSKKQDNTMLWARADKFIDAQNDARAAENGAQTDENDAQDVKSDAQIDGEEAPGTYSEIHEDIYDDPNRGNVSANEIYSQELSEREIERYKTRLEAIKAYKSGGYESLSDEQKRAFDYAMEHIIDSPTQKGLDDAIEKIEKRLYGNNVGLNIGQNGATINTENQDGGNKNAERMEEKGENPGGNQGVRGASENLHVGREAERADYVGKRNSAERHQVLYRVLSENEYTKAVQRTGADVLELYDISDDYETFSKALAGGKANNPKGYMVDGKSVEELQKSGARTFLTEDGSAGALVTKDGDVEGVFKNTKTSKAKGAVHSLLLTAVANGGTKLDCYGADLVTFYNASGFEAVGRVEYVYGYNPEMDEAVKREIASGERTEAPDVYAMKLRDGIDAKTVADRMGLDEREGGFHRQLQEELDALPLYKGENSYDEMLEARDALLEEVKHNKPSEADAKSTGSFNAQKTEAKEGHPNTVGAMQSNPHSYSHAQNTYGTFPEGENPVRVVDVPVETEHGKTTRNVRTQMEAGTTPDSLIPNFEKAIENGDFVYDENTDKDAIERAKNEIIKRGFAESVGKFEELVERDRVLGKNDLVLGEMLYAQAAQTGDTKTAMRLASALAHEFTKAGQAVQAARILKKLSPEGKLYNAQKIVDKLNGKKDKPKGQKEITIDEKLAAKLLGAQTEQEAIDAEEEIKQHIADQIVSTKMDKWNAWRYLSMLGNPKTHIRNFFGNAAFVPARAIKNGIKSIIEAAVSKSNGNYTRTTTLKKATEAQKKAAAESYEQNKKMLLSGGGFRFENDIESRQTVFKNKVLEFLRKGNSELLEREDAWFLKPAYESSFAKYLAANNINPENITPAQLSAAKNYAKREAWKATYRDTSAVATAFEKFSRTNATTKFISDALVPFKKTPINILARGIEYSPVGLIKSISLDAAKVRNRKMEAQEMIDHLASGLTGTGITVLGAVLAHFGLISGGDDENDKVQDFGELQGEQNYALQIGDTSYTIDWLAPISMPLFVGVEAYSALKGEGFDTGDVFSATLDAIGKTADPMIGLSMLQNVEKILSGNYGGEGSGIGNLLKEAVMSYALQAFPTLGSQIAQTIDAKQRNAYYTDKTNELPDVLEIPLNRILAKIPVASMLLPEKVDEWGRTKTQEENIFLRVFENFISPGYISQKNSTEVDEMLSQIYAETGDGSIFPTAMSKYFDVDGERFDLSAQDFINAQKEKGRTAYSLLEQLIADKDFKKLSSEEKADIISDVYSYAAVKGKQAVSDYEPTINWYENMEAAEKAGLSNADFILNRNIYNDLAAKDGQTKNFQMVELLIADKSTNAKQDVAILEYVAGVDMSKYKSATDDYELMLGIYGAVQNEGDKADDIAYLTEWLGGEDIKAFALYSTSTANKKFENGQFKNFGSTQLTKAEALLEKNWQGEDIAKAARAVTGLENYLGKSRKTKKNYIAVLMEVGFTEKQAEEFYAVYGW